MEPAGHFYTLKRGKVCRSGRVEMLGKCSLSLRYCTYTPTEAGFFYGGRCWSCTVAHVLCLHLHCGWMEDRAKCFHFSASIARSTRKDILTDRTDRVERSDRFHSFEGCLQCCSLKGTNRNFKRIPHVAIFRSESVFVLFVATCWAHFLNSSV